MHANGFGKSFWRISKTPEVVRIQQELRAVRVRPKQKMAADWAKRDCPKQAQADVETGTFIVRIDRTWLGLDAGQASLTR